MDEESRAQSTDARVHNCSSIFNERKIQKRQNTEEINVNLHFFFFKTISEAKMCNAFHLPAGEKRR